MIYTLNARGNVLLPVTVNMFNLTNSQYAKMVLDFHNEAIIKLANKGIDYNKLKSALIPVHKNRYEIALIFDSQIIDSDWYGNDVFEHVLPSLNKESTCSILCGDIIADYLPCELVYKILMHDMVKIHPTTFIHPTQYYVVYINNLTSLHKETIISSLNAYQAFVGYVDTTFMSIFKSLISRSLMSICIKHKDTMILRHEDDIDDNENINNCGYKFEKYGFKYISVKQMYYDLFLTYKIESILADQEDLDYSIKAIAPHYETRTNSIYVDKNKMEYLNLEKNGLMTKQNLIKCTSEDLASLINERINKTYFYNLEYIEKYSTPKFNVSLELETVEGKKRKVLVALKYSDNNDSFSLITMY